MADGGRGGRSSILTPLVIAFHDSSRLSTDMFQSRFLRSLGGVGRATGALHVGESRVIVSSLTCSSADHFTVLKCGSCIVEGSVVALR